MKTYQPTVMIRSPQTLHYLAETNQILLIVLVSVIGHLLVIAFIQDIYNQIELYIIRTAHL